MEDLLRRTLVPAIALEMVLAGGLWHALSDPNQLESAILNLAINARDAMTGGIPLTAALAVNRPMPGLRLFACASDGPRLVGEFGGQGCDFNA